MATNDHCVGAGWVGVFIILAHTGQNFSCESTIQVTKHEHILHEHAKFKQTQELAHEYFIIIARLEMKRLGKTSP